MYWAPGVLGAADPGGGPDRGHQGRRRIRPAAVVDHDQGGHRRGELPGLSAVLRRGDPEAAFPGCAHVFEGEFEFAGQEHFYLETNAALASIDENGQIFVQSSTQHRPRRRTSSRTCSASAYHVTVQCLHMGGGFGARDAAAVRGHRGAGHRGHRTPGAGPVQPNRTSHLRQAARLPRVVEGRLRRGRHDPGVDRDADRGRRLEPGPVGTGAGPRPLPHRQRAWIPNIEVHGRISKTNKTSQTAFRGFGGPQGMIVIENILGQCAPAWPERPRAAPTQLLHGRADHPVRPGRAPPGAHR